jgi:ubiquitin fusion degradation protein 1
MFHFLGGQYHGRFEATYRAFPLAFIDKQSAEYGDKVILPPSALDRLGELLLVHSSPAAWIHKVNAQQQT